MTHLAKTAWVTDELQPLAELVRRQQKKFDESRFKFLVRDANHIELDLTQEAITELLDSLGSKSLDECLDTLMAAIPELGNLRVNASKLLTDGTRRRLEFPSKPSEVPHVNIVNGEDMIMNNGSSQVSISEADRKGARIRLHFLAPGDFWNLPLIDRSLQDPKKIPNRKTTLSSVTHADGVWRTDIAINDKLHILEVIDDQTGFVRQSDSYGTHTRQYLPVVLPNGLAVPTLSVRISNRNRKLECAVSWVKQVELVEQHAPDAFFYAAQPRDKHCRFPGIFARRSRRSAAVIKGDFRSNSRCCRVLQSRIPIGSTTECIDGQSGRRSSETCGFSNWLDVHGTIDAPNLKEKIVILDFWRIGCGFCVVQLPEINAAAQHFTGSDVVILGIHDSGGDVDRVAKFAEQRDLIYPLAIDKPAPNDRSFGATSAAFGICGIPTSVVIDRTGRIAYIGTFKRAIAVADQLAKAK